MSVAALSSPLIHDATGLPGVLIGRARTGIIWCTSYTLLRTLRLSALAASENFRGGCSVADTGVDNCPEILVDVSLICRGMVSPRHANTTAS